MNSLQMVGLGADGLPVTFNREPKNPTRRVYSLRSVREVRRQMLLAPMARMFGRPRTIRTKVR